MKSLLTLKQLLDDRRLTRLQEYISKLSAKNVRRDDAVSLPGVIDRTGRPGLHRPVPCLWFLEGSL